MSPSVVVATDLTCAFGTFLAVDGVSFSVAAGEVFGFLGSNGAGKTTTIRMLCGLVTPTAGTASVLGLDVARRPADVQARIGYMSQRFSLYGDLAVDENLRFWGASYGLGGRHLADRIRWALATAELEAVRRRLVRTLPGGLRQRLALVAALLHQPAVVFLDEPTGGVDPRARRRFWDLIDQLSEQGTTVFVTTHSMDEAERCHRVALMHAGRLLALDTVPALKALLPAGTVLGLRCPAPAAAVVRLQAVPGVREAALFGDSVHVAVDRPGRVQDVRAALIGAGISPEVLEPITPSLEDAFIHVIGAATGEAP